MYKHSFNVQPGERHRYDVVDLKDHPNDKRLYYLVEIAAGTVNLFDTKDVWYPGTSHFGWGRGIVIRVVGKELLEGTIGFALEDTTSIVQVIGVEKDHKVRRYYANCSQGQFVIISHKLSAAVGLWGVASKLDEVQPFKPYIGDLDHIELDVAKGIEGEIVIETLMPSSNAYFQPTARPRPLP